MFPICKEQLEKRRKAKEEADKKLYEFVKNNIFRAIEQDSSVALGINKHILDLKIENKTLREQLYESGWIIEPKVEKVYKKWSWRKFRFVEVKEYSDLWYRVKPIEEEL